MKINNLLFLPIIIGSLVSTCLPANAWIFNKIFGTKPKEYVARLAALTEMEQTLIDISKVRGAVGEQEKTIAAMSAKLRKEAYERIQKAEKELKDLIEILTTKGKTRIADLKNRIDRRQGDITKLKDALNAESTLVNWAETANKITFGRLATAVNWVHTWDEAGRKQTEDKIVAINKDLAELDKLLQKEKTALTAVLLSDEYQKQATAISKEKNDATAAFADIQNIISDTKKAQIFDVYNSKADALMKTLNQNIKDANCPSIRTIADTKNDKINECKIANLKEIKTRTNIGVCTSLQLNSNIGAIQSCASTLK